MEVSAIRDSYLGKNGLHLNRRGADRIARLIFNQAILEEAVREESNHSKDQCGVMNEFCTVNIHVNMTLTAACNNENETADKNKNGF